MANQFYNLGFRRTLDAAQSGENLRPVITQMVKSVATPHGARLLEGAVTGLLTIYSAATKAGYSASSPDARVQEFLDGGASRRVCVLVQGLAGVDPALTCACLVALCEFANAMHGKLNIPLPAATKGI